MMLDLFFSKLASRFISENDLSDVTWAMCESLPEFKRLFLLFFFKEDFENHSINDFTGISLQREFPRNGCRPDFYFESTKEYIIEVKKYDKDDHFEKYKINFPNAQFGWIANYTIESQDGIETRSWEKFKAFLEDQPVSKNKLIRSYIGYLKKVCAIINLQKMKLDCSPLFLIKTISNIINEQRTAYSTKVYRNHKDGANFLACDEPITELRIGEYFSITKKKENLPSTIYPWFGIYFLEKSPRIRIEFSHSPGWCKPVYDTIMSQTNIGPGKYSTAPENYDDFGKVVAFQLKDDWFDKINNAEDLKEQEVILKSYFEEVIQRVETYW